MSKFKIISTKKVDIKNGFKVGQIIEGEIKNAEFTDGTVGEILEVENNDCFLMSNQVEPVNS